MPKIININDELKQTLCTGIFTSLALDDQPDGADQRGLLTEEDARIINSLPKNPPPVPVKAGEAYVREVRLLGVTVNNQLGSPRPEDMETWLALSIGVPLMVGHKKDEIPMSRFFTGRVVDYQGVPYIVLKFYWDKSLSYAEDMRIKIDSGLINEASISIRFGRPTCSICGLDLRDMKCPHWVGEEYDGQLCFYWYDEPVCVLEGSIVYKGADPGTGFGMPESLKAALDLKQEKLQIEKQGGIKMPIDFNEVKNDLGLADVKDMSELKSRIQTGDSAVKELQTVKTENAELTKFKTAAEPVITARHDDAVRLLNLRDNGKPDALIQKTLKSASPEETEKFIVDLEEQVRKLYPDKCQKCGSTNIEIRSSVDEGLKDTDLGILTGVNIEDARVGRK